MRRLDALVSQDIRDIENLRDLSGVETLIRMLPGKVGGLLSVNSLREDLLVAHKTAASWVDVLERFYYHFRILPHQSSRIKALREPGEDYIKDGVRVISADKFLTALA